MIVWVNDIYSIGSLKTNESGALYALFNIPGGAFHTGQKILTIDNSVNNNANSATTSASGVFFAQGMQETMNQVTFPPAPVPSITNIYTTNITNINNITNNNTTYNTTPVNYTGNGNYRSQYATSEAGGAGNVGG
jgi:hypothetical protein